MIRDALDRILPPDLRLRVRKQLPPPPQHLLVERAHREADGVRGLVAPEQPAAAGRAESPRAAPGRMVPRERRLRREREARRGHLVEPRDEGAAVLSALGALAGCALKDGQVRKRDASEGWAQGG
ncbi:hypothetical protein ACJZ2D_010710 [Fusarium nematophilum]